MKLSEPSFTRGLKSILLAFQCSCLRADGCIFQKRFIAEYGTQQWPWKVLIYLQSLTTFYEVVYAKIFPSKC
jgi:hypothetical protein